MTDSAVEQVTLTDHTDDVTTNYTKLVANINAKMH